MTWKTWAKALSVSVVLTAAGSASAFDRQDGPAATNGPGTTPDPSTDINDLYAWKDPTTGRIFFIMTVFPNADKTTARFSSSNLYVIHTNARASMNDTNPATEVSLICKFDNSQVQNVECWAGQQGQNPTEYLKGPTGNRLASQSGNLIAQAQVRNDPFFMNETNLLAAMTSIGTTVTTKKASRNAAGCYPFVAADLTTVHPATAGTGTLPAPPAAVITDSYKTKNVLSIALSVDASVLIPGGKPVLTVWGSTNKPAVM